MLKNDDADNDDADDDDADNDDADNDDADDDVDHTDAAAATAKCNACYSGKPRSSLNGHHLLLSLCRPLLLSSAA